MYRNRRALNMITSQSGVRRVHELPYSLEEEGGERHTDDHQVEHVESVPTEGAWMQEGSVHRHLEKTMEGRVRS